MKLKHHQGVKLQQNKQSQGSARQSEQQQYSERSYPESSSSSRMAIQRHHQSPPQNADGEMYVDSAGNNQSNPRDEEIIEPGQLSNHQGSHRSPSPRGSVTQIKQAQAAKLSPGSQHRQNLMIVTQLPKQSKSYMQQQNRPIQKGKRVFLEMRDSQMVASGSQVQQLPSATSSLSSKVMVSKQARHSRNADRSPPNKQLQQKVVNSQEDDLFQLDSESDLPCQQPQAKAAIHELRQLSSRSERRQNVAISAAAQSLGAATFSKHQHQQSAQMPPHLDMKHFIEDQTAQRSFPSESQVKSSPHGMAVSKGRSARRKGTDEYMESYGDQNEPFSSAHSGSNIVMSVHGPLKMKNPSSSHRPVTHSTSSLAASIILSHDQLAKQVAQITKQISLNHELVLKDRGFAHVPEALRFSCHMFEQLLVLDLQNNSIAELDGDFCQNFPCLEKLDLRNNKLKTMSPHIKALMSLTVLRLDNNNLVQLVPQIGNLKLLEELSVSGNRIYEIPYCFGESLTQLHTLNVADNCIKSLPASLGNLGKYSLKCLFLHGNSFTSFPSTFLHMCNLEELSLEWFLYAKPSKPKLVRRCTEDGRNVFESLEQLFNLLVRHSMNECMLIIFLEYYSVEDFEVNHKDNRQRTPLHNAAAKGDNGVLEGLLQGNADPNILDKDNCTPLCLAIRDEKFAAAQILIDSEEVDVNMGGGIYGSPLHLAVVKLEIWLIKALIKKGADVNKTDCDGKTALHFVMNLFSKNPQKCQYIAETLVLNGAKPNLKDSDNWTPLHTAVRKGQDKGVAAIAKLNTLLTDKEKFEMNATGGVHKWTALHLAAHGSHLNIVRELLRAGADIFQRNSNKQLPRHCAKGNYILTKFIKMAEQSRSAQSYNSYVIGNQFQLIRGLTMRKPEEAKGLQAGARPRKTTSAGVNMQEMIQGYNNFVSTLKLVRKHRPFAENDNLPKICQPEDHIEVSSPRSSSSDLDDDDEDDQAEAMAPGASKVRHQQKEAIQVDNKFGDSGSGGPNSDTGDLIPASGPEMGPNCNLKSMFRANSEALNSGKLHGSMSYQTSTDRFQRLATLAEERKVNLFYLRDIVLGEASTTMEKLDALAQIRKNVSLPVFKFAIEPVLQKFHSINERATQYELISIIGKSQQPDLMRGLQKLLVCDVKKLHPDIIDEIEDAICELRAFSKLQQAQSGQSQLPRSRSLVRARNVSGSGQKNLSLSRQAFQAPSFQQQQAPSPHPQSVQPAPVGGGQNQSVLAMSIHSQLAESNALPQGSNSFQHQGLMENAPILPDPSRRLGHPGAIRSDMIFDQVCPSEDTIKQGGRQLFGRPAMHGEISSVHMSLESSSLASQVTPYTGSISGASAPGKTRQVIVCDGQSQASVDRQSQMVNQPANRDSIPPSFGGSVQVGSVREKNLAPSNKLVAKQHLHQSLLNNMSSSLQSSNNMQCEEDVSSSHVDTEKPNMSINPSLTYSVAGIARDNEKMHRSARGQEEPKVMRSRQERGSPQSQERPNQPRASQKVKQGSTSLYVAQQNQMQQQQQQQQQQHPGHGLRTSFTNQVSLSFGSMSDSLNTRFLMKKQRSGLPGAIGQSQTGHHQASLFSHSKKMNQQSSMPQK